MMKDKAIKEFQSTIDWLRNHKNCGVSHSAFMKACNDSAIMSAQSISIRVPFGVLDNGYKTLDFAAAILRMHIPTDVLFAELPGFFAEELCECECDEPPFFTPLVIKNGTIKENNGN